MEKIKQIISKLRKSIIFKCIAILILSVGLTVVNLYYSKVDFPREMFFSYFRNKLIFLLNFLPILWLMILIFILCKRMSVAFFVTTATSYSITLANYFKISLRNDPLFIEDITLIKEALQIKDKYTFNFTWLMITFIIFFIVVTFLLYLFFDRVREKKQILRKEVIIKIVSTVAVFIIGMAGLNTIYINGEVYSKLSNTSLINIWSSTHQYMSRGTIYSFLNSYSQLKKSPPKGYNKNQASEQLSKYEYSNIPDDKKVNIIGIMLEAYNDFSKFDEIEFERNPYESWNKIKEQSVSGELVTDIFAGGTIDTERKFMTGYTEIGTLRKRTNSYVSYFKEQGYYTTGAHPSYEWFYNRKNINRNLGFDNYFFKENRYYKFNGDTIIWDNEYIPDLLELYKNRDKSVPYFSFNVSYQNHGPYGTDDWYHISYVKRKESYTDAECNILNNYLWGIEKTSDELLKMIEELKDDEDPVVIILFGDHNPWLGNNNSVYEMLGINFDLDTDEGIYNYYNTPYIIWANDKAKEVLQNDFVGEGETFGPYFLMNKFFELAGYEGNEFMKFSNEMKESITVVNSNFYVLNGRIVRDLPDEEKSKFNEFKKVEYYWENNYRQK